MSELHQAGPLTSGYPETDEIVKRHVDHGKTTVVPYEFRAAVGTGLTLAVTLFVVFGLLMTPSTYGNGPATGTHHDVGHGAADAVAGSDAGLHVGASLSRYLNPMLESAAPVAPWVSAALVVLVLVASRRGWTRVLEYLGNVSVDDGDEDADPPPRAPEQRAAPTRRRSIRVPV